MYVFLEKSITESELWLSGSEENLERPQQQNKSTVRLKDMGIIGILLLISCIYCLLDTTVAVYKCRPSYPDTRRHQDQDEWQMQKRELRANVEWRKINCVYAIVTPLWRCLDGKSFDGNLYSIMSLCKTVSIIFSVFHYFDMLGVPFPHVRLATFRCAKC